MPPSPTRSARIDGEQTRSRILEAAGELFAAAGFASTPSKAVAARAGVDLASINYHFGSRAGLYQAVLIEAHHRMLDTEDLRRLARSPLPATEKLRALIDWIVPKQKSLPDSGRRAAAGTEDGSEVQPAGAQWPLTVLAAEILAPSTHIEGLFQQEVMPKAAQVQAILSEISGIPPQHPASVRCALSVIAPCFLLVLGQRGVPGPARAVLQMPRHAVIEHLHGFALAGLQAAGQAYRRTAADTSPDA